MTPRRAGKLVEIVQKTYTRRERGDIIRYVIWYQCVYATRLYYEIIQKTYTKNENSQKGGKGEKSYYMLFDSQCVYIMSTPKSGKLRLLWEARVWYRCVKASLRRAGKLVEWDYIKDIPVCLYNVNTTPKGGKLRVLWEARGRSHQRFMYETKIKATKKKKRQR